MTSTRGVTFGVTLGALSLAIGLSAAPERQYAPKPAASVPTFSKDVAPILFKNCTGCHRAGEIAPMSLLTYEDARPWAKAIRDEVSEGHMPPWHADAKHGTFANDRSLSASDKETLVKWANGGAPRGNPADLPPTPKYTEGWSIGQPDLVLSMAEDYKVPADGFVEYQVHRGSDEPDRGQVDPIARSSSRQPRRRPPRHRLRQTAAT